MSNTIENVAIMTKVNSDEAHQTAKSVNMILLQKKINVFAVLPLCGEKMTSVNINSIKDLNIDLILAIGKHLSHVGVASLAHCEYDQSD